MLYKLLYECVKYWFGFNVFKYITVRATLATFTSLIISIIFGKKFINSMKRFCHPNDFLNFRENNKKDIPTMGGIFILSTLLFSTILWADISNIYILLLIFLTIYLALFGYWDDMKKLVNQSSRKGLRPIIKIVAQVGAGLVIGIVLVYGQGINFDTSVYLPFFKKVVIPLGEYYILFAIFLIVATSNAVNLTDGMDGLAIGSVMIVTLAYAAISYLAGNIKFAEYLSIPYVKGAEEVTIFTGALVGSCLGFLWYNCYPAEIFMGDTGSLPLGGIIGFLAIIVKQELSLIFVGGIFLIEGLSVVIQIISVKTRGKKVFLMTPLHHHFEKRGIPESKVVIRFLILTLILSLFTVITLKIR
ncbi:MAG TPA: phospho-N-acetylmuramoyl-pentapeptide-transferase [bacterium]|nr:phospho-N-acetylmuramoyl-pentapeptide-transferase [bacterium]